ncbi:MAG TPA: sigma-54 dependent transcriptional regulator [bacterium]|nr:sigma-54 dependent transcriptional regulator [bacterium]HOL47496.1 sigma-54 dependent transcriptional regulator [bacterium]HPQ19582.1 sigma-54 dependent transcriptional regulator [bacterium]
MENEKRNILIIEDDEIQLNSLAEGLEVFFDNVNILKAKNGEEGLKILNNEDIAVTIIDLFLQDKTLSGMDILKEIKSKLLTTEVIMITGHSSVETAVEAMQKGAFTYLTKPINLSELREVVKRALESQYIKLQNINLKNLLEEKFSIKNIIGRHPTMLKIFETIKLVAPTNASVLIQGESGTGKELIARAIHYNSLRTNGAFIAMNCAAISEGILESELFGHEKGAFTGAIAQKKGKFEMANKGTLFLDEIGDMPLSTQVKLLRVLEVREFERVGGSTPIKVDIRLISATNQDLEQLVQEKRFREDLYFRIKVITIKIPPLRERKSDIPFLIQYFIETFSKENKKEIVSIDKNCLKILYDYDWPGNVRELKNVIESMMIVAQGNVLTIDDIPDEIKKNSTIIKRVNDKKEIRAGLTLNELEKQLIEETLKYTNGKKVEAAKMLGIGLRTLYRKIEEYKLNY